MLFESPCASAFRSSFGQEKQKESALDSRFVKNQCPHALLWSYLFRDFRHKMDFQGPRDLIWLQGARRRLYGKPQGLTTEFHHSRPPSIGFGPGRGRLPTRNISSQLERRRISLQGHENLAPEAVALSSYHPPPTSTRAFHHRAPTSKYFESPHLRRLLRVVTPVASRSGN